MTGEWLLVRAREAAGLSQTALAQRARTSRPTLSAYEHGRKSPSLATAVRIVSQAGFELSLSPRIEFVEAAVDRGRPILVPTALPRLSLGDAFVTAVKRHGWTVTFLVDTPTFCRMHVVGGSDEVLVDLALDSPPKSPPIITVLGPTLVPLELAGRKLLALFGRAEARDFADVYVLAERFGIETLTTEAAAGDAGFDVHVLADMMATLDRFSDEEIRLPPAAVADARSFFARWTSTLRSGGATS